METGKKSFNVIVESQGRFKAFDIMPYLLGSWGEFMEKAKELEDVYDPDDYWKIPETREDIKRWIDRELKYQFWSRCEYEIILSEWPNPKNNPGKKIDVYEQCAMNIEVITDIFIYNIGSGQAEQNT